MAPVEVEKDGRRRRELTGQRMAYGLAQAAAQLSVSPEALRLEILRGALPARRFGRRLLVLHDDLVAFAGGLTANRVARTGARVGDVQRPASASSGDLLPREGTMARRIRPKLSERSEQGQIP
jgi:hypothetical protein